MAQRATDSQSGETCRMKDRFAKGRKSQPLAAPQIGLTRYGRQFDVKQVPWSFSC